MSQNTSYRALLLAFLGAIRGRAYAKFSLGLVSIGAILAFPPAWELLLPIALHIWRKFDPTIPTPATSSGSTAGPFIGGLLMLFGIAMFLIFFLRDERLRLEQEKSARYLRVSIPKIDSWIRQVLITKDSHDPRYHYELPLLFETGDSEVRVYSIAVTRYCFGCACWTLNPTLREVGGNRTTYYFQGDDKHLQTPLHLPTGHSHSFWYVGEGAGPAPGFDIDELESAEYDIEITYRLGAIAESQELTIFVRQHRGSVDVIKGISQTPFLSDEAIRKAVVAGVITMIEEAQLLRLTARERFLTVRLGNQYARRKEHTKESELFVKAIHERILLQSDAQG